MARSRVFAFARWLAAAQWDPHGTRGGSSGSGSIRRSRRPASDMRTDVTFVGAMQMVVADMVPDTIGTWLYHCHISFHLADGMLARYAVVNRTGVK